MRLSVAGSVRTTDRLATYDLAGATFIIDPVPRAGSPDVTLEVARKLRAFLEASHATVLLTRTSVTTQTALADRAAVASRVASPTAAIVLDVATTGRGGMSLTVPASSGAAPSMTASLPAVVARSLSESGFPVAGIASAPDPVLTAIRAPGVRVIIGNASQPSDAASFQDPDWVERVARALLRAIGSMFASDGATP